MTSDFGTVDLSSYFPDTNYWSLLANGEGNAKKTIFNACPKNSIISYKKKTTKIKKNFKMFVLMVKPNFGCSTKSIFNRVRHYSKPQLSKIRSKNIDFNLISKLKNDLEIISTKKYPRLQKLRDYFLNIDKNSYVRMSGSGSTIVGYFKSKKAALNAKKLLRKNYKN